MNWTSIWRWQYDWFHVQHWKLSSYQLSIDTTATAQSSQGQIINSISISPHYIWYQIWKATQLAEWMAQWLCWKLLSSKTVTHWSQDSTISLQYIQQVIFLTSGMTLNLSFLRQKRLRLRLRLRSGQPWSRSETKGRRSLQCWSFQCLQEESRVYTPCIWCRTAQESEPHTWIQS